MANLKRDRGQIILVAAFALAVIFLTLALVVNSAIFTENLASRSDTTGSGDALSDRAALERSVGNAIAAANRNKDTNPKQRKAVNNSLALYRTQIGHQQATSGTLTNVSYNSSRAGKRINYTGGGNFDDGDQTFVSDVSQAPGGNGTRAFVINSTDLPNGEENAFNISVTGSAGTWTTHIWHNDTEDTVNISTTRSGEGTEECYTSQAPTDAAVIDVTGGDINGVPCDALGITPGGTNFHFAAGTLSGPTDTYDIEFENAANIDGKFSVVVHSEGGSVSVDSVGSDEPALYQVTVDYSYTTTDVHYVTEIRVAPGEPDA